MFVRQTICQWANQFVKTVIVAQPICQKNVFVGQPFCQKHGCETTNLSKICLWDNHFVKNMVVAQPICQECDCGTTILSKIWLWNNQFVINAFVGQPICHECVFGTTNLSKHVCQTNILPKHGLNMICWHVCLKTLIVFDKHLSIFKLNTLPMHHKSNCRLNKQKIINWLKLTYFLYKKSSVFMSVGNININLKSKNFSHLGSVGGD